MLNLKINKNKSIDINAVIFKIFIFISLMFPYLTIDGKRNHKFILSTFICFIIVIISIFKKRFNVKYKKFLVVYTLILILYNIVCLIYNIIYHHYYIEQINKFISFSFLIILIMKIDKEFLNKNNIIQFLIKIINITVSLSIIYFLMNGDGIKIQNTQIYFTKQGYFSDSRLTWVFGHKSSYALMLILFLSLIIKYKELFKYKLNYFLSILISAIALVLSGSSTALALGIITIIFIMISKYDFKKNYIIIFLLPIISIIIYIIVIYVYNYIAESRDLSTLGMRTYIYGAAKYYLDIYPNGIGKQFGEINMSYGVMTVENLHNIFLNEMLRFSIPVGIFYTVIFVIISVYTVINNKIFAVGVWISCYGLFFMDYSLRTDLLPIFILFIYLLFFADTTNKVNKKIIRFKFTK